jgi:hypothetical protein
VIIELRGHHNETLVRIDTNAYAHCAGIFIEVTPQDGHREHFPDTVAFPPWNPPRKFAELTDPPAIRQDHATAISTRHVGSAESRASAP